MKKTIKDVAIDKNTIAILRADFNVPLDENLNLIDTKRIDSTLPTIDYLLLKNAKIVLLSHLGRPCGIDKKFSLRPVYDYLKTIYKDNIMFSDEIYGKSVKLKVQSLKNGQILLCENVRFLQGEEENDEDLAKNFAQLGNLFVNDAFATAHRKHASTYGVAKLLPSVAGLLMGSEINNILHIIDSPLHPYTAIIGGAKISDKINLIESLINKCDNILIGGAMANTFISAVGGSVGKSLIEKESITSAQYLIELASKYSKNLMLPSDLICADDLTSDNISTEKSFDVSPNKSAFDIGPKTISDFSNIILNSKTIIWNGPLGVFENNNFENGTKQIAFALSKSKAKTLVGGGDSASALKKFKLTKTITHISTGGGASLKLIEKGTLPCVEVLQNK